MNADGASALRVEPDYAVRSVLRAAGLLRLIAADRENATLAGLSKQSGLSKPTVFRLVRTLIEAGLVEVVPRESSFRLGPLCAVLGQAYLDQADALREARPILQALRDETGETVHFGVLDQDMRVLYQEKLESTHAIGVMKSRVGLTVPAHCTGIGKMLLAATGLRPPAASLERFTTSTISDPGVLDAELETSRIRGYALDLQEHELGVYCVSVPVFDSTGAAVGALSVAGPGDRMPRERLEGELLRASLSAAGAVSVRLGWSGRLVGERR